MSRLCNDLRNWELNESILDRGIFKAVFMAGAGGSGKAQPLYSPILTMVGWKTMGDVKVGDVLISPTGGTTIITHLHPQGEKDVYRLHLLDGRAVDATGDHLWFSHGVRMKKVTRKGKRVSINVWGEATTSEIKKKIESPTNRKREVFLPLTEPIDFQTDKKLPMNPYLLGVVLGGGCLRQPNAISIAIGDQDFSAMMQNIELYTPYYFDKRDNDYFIRGNKANDPDSYLNILRTMGLMGCYSNNKFIPEEYKTSSIENRLELMRGLMDTDGYSSKNGATIEYYTVSNQLAEDVKFIVRSLGDNVKHTTKHTHYKNKAGVRIICQDINILQIYSHTPEKYFKLERKKVKASTPGMQKRWKNNKLKVRVEKVEYIGRHVCQCITVEKEDGLYITNDFIVTHNSYVTTKVKSGAIDPRVVNIDKFIELYGRGYEKEYFDLSRKQTTKQLIQYVNSLLPLAIDNTSKKHEVVIKRANILEGLGYDTAMIYVNTSLDTSLQRASTRKRKVPEEEIISAYEYLQKSKPFLRAKFGLFLEVNNEDGEFTDDVITKIFKKMAFFYDNPVRNPIGIETIELMRKNGWKYLMPEVYTLNELESMLIPFHGKI